MEELTQRLQDRVNHPEKYEGKDLEQIQKTTDLVREVLLPRYAKRGLPILTQIRLIHRAHMNRNEEVILSSDQAERLLDRNITTTDRLAGVVRSTEVLPVDVSMASGIILGTSFEQTPQILSKLANKAEEYFGLNKPHQLVNEETIYNYASAFQLLFALCHPFYECNGRTSEDLMYALWYRRPDLLHEMRYVSSNGKRQDSLVAERGKLIDGEGVTLLKLIAKLQEVPAEVVDKIKNVSDLHQVVQEMYPTTEYNDEDSVSLFDVVYEQLIDQIDNQTYILRYPTINALANNLRSGSSVYTLRDGRTLPASQQ